MQQQRVGTTIIHRDIIFVYGIFYYDYTAIMKPSRRQEVPGET